MSRQPIVSPWLGNAGARALVTVRVRPRLKRHAAPLRRAIAGKTGGLAAPGAAPPASDVHAAAVLRNAVHIVVAPIKAAERNTRAKGVGRARRGVVQVKAVGVRGLRASGGEGLREAAARRRRLAVVFRREEPMIKRRRRRGRNRRRKAKTEMRRTATVAQAATPAGAKWCTAKRRPRVGRVAMAAPQR